MKRDKGKIDGMIKDITLGVIQNGKTQLAEGFEIDSALISFFQKEMETDAFKPFTAGKITQDGVAEIQDCYDAHVTKFRTILSNHFALP
jgi:hypothetical protein